MPIADAGNMISGAQSGKFLRKIEKYHHQKYIQVAMARIINVSGSMSWKWE
jgi:hypothetical protein